MGDGKETSLFNLTLIICLHRSCSISRDYRGSGRKSKKSSKKRKKSKNKSSMEATGETRAEVSNEVGGGTLKFVF